MMLRREPTFRSELMTAANTLPWTLLDVTAAFPEETGRHRLEGEWTVRDQLLHLQNVELRYTIPNLKAIRAGGAYVPFGDEDREPDEGQPLEAIRTRLAEIYNERVQLLLKIPPEAWGRSLQRPDGRAVNVEDIALEECVQHDAEHLAQLLRTFWDWRKTVQAPAAGGVPGDGTLRPVLTAAANALETVLLDLLATLPEESAAHRLPDEWSAGEQVRHLIYNMNHYLIPNLRAVAAGGAYVPYGATAGVDDLEPAEHRPLAELRRLLRAGYAERDALLVKVASETDGRSVISDQGRPLTLDSLLLDEAVAHDCDHLSQLLSTVRDWRLKTGLAVE